MTTIIAVQKKNKVLLGYDSQATYNTGEYLRLRDGKLAKNGPYTFAVTGWSDFSPALEDADLPVPGPGEDVRRFLRKTLAPAISKLEKEKYGDHANSLLIVINGEVFTYSHNHIGDAIREGVYCLGSGGKYAQTYLMSLRRPILSSDVRRALNISSSRDAYTSGPFFVKEVR